MARDSFWLCSRYGPFSLGAAERSPGHGCAGGSHGPLRLAVAGCFLAGQAWGLVATWPCFLSYYNIAVGGLRGADRLGMELDYWGEAVTRDFLEQVVQTVPDGAHIDVTPVLLPHGLQLDEMLTNRPFSADGGSCCPPMWPTPRATRITCSSFGGWPICRRHFKR